MGTLPSSKNGSEKQKPPFNTIALWIESQRLKSSRKIISNDFFAKRVVKAVYSTQLTGSHTELFIS
jgi:hypothetical protein